MRGKYTRPSELLKLQKETGKSYWDLIGRPLYDEGKDVEVPVQEVEDPNITAAIKYAMNLKIDNALQSGFDSGKDNVAGNYNFNAIPQISPNAGLSYDNYYDKITGDLFMDINQKVPTYKKGKDDYLNAPDFISHYEGFRDTVYQNKGDKPTVGYGNTEEENIQYARRKGKITVEEGKQMLQKHLNDTVIPQLQKNIPGYANMPEQAQWVLQDILYNVGTGGLFRKSPKFMKAIREGNWEEAARHMDWDNNKPGYSKGARDRNAERQRVWNNAWSSKNKTYPKNVEEMMENTPQFNPQVVKYPVSYNLLPQDAKYDPTVPKSINKDSGVLTWPRSVAVPNIIDSYNKLWQDSPVIKPVWRTE